MQDQRLKCAQLWRKNDDMVFEFKKSNFSVYWIEWGLTQIFSNEDRLNAADFMNLLYQHQRKLFSSSAKHLRFHSMIIRFCLSLASKSVYCYEKLRNSAILKLSSQRNVWDYRNFVKLKAGFNNLLLMN